MDEFAATRRRFPIGETVYPLDPADNRTGKVVGYGLLPWTLVVVTQRPDRKKRETISHAALWAPWHELTPF